MRKYLVLYRTTASPKAQMASATPAQAKAGMDAWMQWAGKAGPALVDMGAPAGDSILLGGTVAPGFIGGYSIVTAASDDAARALFDGHPHFHAPGASIELLELVAIPGM